MTETPSTPTVNGRDNLTARDYRTVIADVLRRPGGIVEYDTLATVITTALDRAGFAVVKLPEIMTFLDDDGQEYWCDGEYRVDHTATGTGLPALYRDQTPWDPASAEDEALNILAAARSAKAVQP